MGYQVKKNSIAIRRQTPDDRTLYATWSWNKSNGKKYEHTSKFETAWLYQVAGKSTWFIGSESSVNYHKGISPVATYTPDDSAVRVKFRVLPVATTHTVKKKKKQVQVKYYNGTWSKFEEFQLKGDFVVETPPTPNIEIDDFKLTASVDVYATNSKWITFEIVKDDSVTVYSQTVQVVTNHAAIVFTVAPGGSYKARARASDAKSGGNYSSWSEYSGSEKTPPDRVTEILSIEGVSGTDSESSDSGFSVTLTWTPADGAESYEIAYTKNKSYFEESAEQVQTVDTETTATTHILSAIEASTWYFRVRAKNDVGEGGWSDIKDCAVGSVPTAPTIWTYSETAVLGDPIDLHWAHNSEDGSEQTAAVIKLSVNNGTETEIDVEGKSMTYSLDTSSYSDGDKISWAVKTKGAVTEYGPYSATKQIKVYAQPTITLQIKETTGPIDILLTTFPFSAILVTSPVSQHLISADVEIISNDDYDGIDYSGSAQHVRAGSSVFSEILSAEDFTETEDGLALTFNPGNVDLDNGISYTLRVNGAFDSGLTAAGEKSFTTSFDDETYELDGEVNVDMDDLTATIYPTATIYNEATDDWTDAENVIFSVFRREYDGSLTEIMTNFAPGSTIVDPHPALDYARYRVVCTSTLTGLMSFYDVPAEAVSHDSIVITWDEAWRPFDYDDADVEAEAPWIGSMIQLPYNVDISVENSPDVELVDYIGRRNPVSYYGTKRGETGRWQAEIPLTDEETLYNLRMLAAYPGDVYVREPSGIGYWAHVTVSYDIVHKKTTIPVTFSITRVEGGI